MTQNQTIPIERTEFFEAVMDDVYGKRSGGAIIFVDAENARKGVAKTSAAVALARLFAQAFDYELEEDDFMIAGPQYVRRYQEQPGSHQPSVLVPDELVGGGAGDARRAMSGANVNMGRAFQLLRKRRVITIATLPDWNEADTRLQKYADYRVQCLEQPIGYVRTYKVTTPFNSAGSGVAVKNKGLGPGDNTRRIKFPNMDAHGDRFYNYLEEQKDELLETDEFDAGELREDDDDSDEISKDEAIRRDRIETALRLYKPWEENPEATYEGVAHVLPEYGDEWVGKKVRAWRRGEYRDLVPDPTN